MLRRVVATLHEQAGYAWAGILFVEEDDLALGPEAGAPAGLPRSPGTCPSRGRASALRSSPPKAAPPADAAFLARVAALVAGHCLVGWDTGGEPWES